jgi:hypothetical protein
VVLDETENIGCTDSVTNEASNRVMEERNIAQTIKLQKANWIGHILHRICLFKTHYGNKTREVRKDKQEDVSSYWMPVIRREHTNLKGKALDHALGSSLWKMLWTRCNADYAVDLTDIPSKSNNTCQNKACRK